MSNRARNFRRRTGGDDDDDDNYNIKDSNAKNGPSTTTATTTTTKSLLKPSSTSASKPKRPPNQSTKLLSFADDEDNETPSRSKPSSSSKLSSSSSRLSKPTSSHKMTALKDRLPHSSSSSPSSSSLSLPSNVQPQAGTYTKEALRELQKNTRTLASSKPSSEPVIVLKGLLKPSELAKSDWKLDSEEEDEPDELKERRGELASMEIGAKGRDRDNSSPEPLIPDQATINAIRAKRERLRQSRAAAPDFIALDAGSNHGEAEGLSDEEPENQTRIAMFGEKAEGPKKGVFEDDIDDRGIELGLLRRKQGVLEENHEDDEDEEDKIWEEEQFRKGLGKTRIDDGGKNSVVPVVKRETQQKFVSSVGSQTLPPSASIGGTFGGSSGGSSTGLGLGMMPFSQQAEIALNAIDDNVRRLKETHDQDLVSLNKADKNLSDSLLNITALEKSLSAADEKYKFTQKLRDFISIICDFLQHKAPFIEELEDQMQKLHEKHASAIVERRTANNDDEMMEVEAEVNAAMSIFSKKGSNVDVVAAAKSAAQAASAALREQGNLPVKLDEFGRDMNLQKRMEMKGRAEARQCRKARFDSKRLSSMDVDGPYQRMEGESSTDESDSESTAFESHRELLLQTAAHIFSDASEEYSQLSVVKERFEEWKREYSSTYSDAYMSLSAPSIFSPYVRLELLKWDPLHEKTDFLNMNWHSLLMDYGVPEDGGGFAPDDADANLVPELVEKVALRILHHEIVHCWDMLSTLETRNAVAATSLVTDYVPASSEALADLLVAIRTRLADAVANLTVPTWSPPVLQAVPNAARLAAYRFGVSVRLMKNICLWKEILALPVLEKLALDELLCGKVLPHVRSIAANVHDAIPRTEKIVASLSGVWAGPSVTGDRSRKLQPLVDYLMLLRKILEKKHESGVTESETSGLARRLKKMLVELNEYDKARDIARTFHLKEAL
ncbi:GC-rich sequence DNA-binding factor 1 [Morus notabilis]|uniref:GC-rich sequence DNA-binding factor 1 n=1 Tax=Morus notabilis TaxID=981085 RepID=W9QTU3_9ROSA|nr:transcriptional repressor ILP1 [Morus notabilis]EXB53993.1 GC-rich sequence DNA-binding factor 1 [Morus notabilis]